MISEAGSWHERLKLACVHLLLALVLLTLVELPIHFLRSHRAVFRASVITAETATYQVFYASDESGFREEKSLRFNSNEIDADLGDTAFVRLDFDARPQADFSIVAPVITGGDASHAILQRLEPNRCHDCVFAIADDRISVHTTGDDPFLVFARTSAATRHVRVIEHICIFLSALIVVWLTRRWVAARLAGSTAWQYAIVAGVFAAAFVVVTPPLQGPDESNHYARALSLSYGHIRETRVGEHDMGAYLPDPVVRLDALWKQPLAFHSERQIESRDLVDGLEMPWEPHTSFVSFPNTAVYSPVSYIPMVVGVGFARAVSARPIAITYFCRFANAAFAVTLICFALSIAGELAPLYLAIALMPMGVFLGSMCSPDGTTNALLLALLALTLRAFREPLSRRALVILTCTALAVAGVKLPYSSLLLFPLFLPARAFPSREVMIRWKVLTGAACVVILGAWALAIRKVTAEVFPVSVINGEMLRAHPERFVVALRMTLDHDFMKYCREFIGVLGWLDTHLPPYAYYAGGVLVVLSVLASRYEATALARAAMVVLGAFMAVFAFLAMFVTWSAPGNMVIDGVQGRYFIPSMMLFMLALTPKRFAQTLRLSLVDLLPLCFCIMLSIALDATWHRYYGS